jgi:hypothetical protein
MHFIGAVVEGMAEDLIKSEFFGKMVITTYGWQAELSGLPIAGGRASITSRYGQDGYLAHKKRLMGWRTTGA